MRVPVRRDLGYRGLNEPGFGVQYGRTSREEPRGLGLGGLGLWHETLNSKLKEITGGEFRIYRVFHKASIRYIDLLFRLP